MAYYESARDLDNSISALYHWASSGSSWVGSTNKTFNQLTISASPNFPPNSSASRYICCLPGEICSTNFTNFPFNVKNINTTTILTRVEYNQTLTANTFKVFPSTCSTPERIELHVGTGSNQAGNTLDWDGYFIGSMLSSTWTSVMPGIISTGKIDTMDGYKQTYISSGVATTFVGILPIIVEIGVWNMNTDLDKIVYYPFIDKTKIRGISVQIFDDTGLSGYELNSFYVPTSALAGGTFGYYSTYIYLNRSAGGRFDSVSYDSTIINRGLITFWYQTT